MLTDCDVTPALAASFLVTLILCIFFVNVKMYKEALTGCDSLNISRFDGDLTKKKAVSSCGNVTS